MQILKQTTYVYLKIRKRTHFRDVQTRLGVVSPNFNQPCSGTMKKITLSIPWVQYDPITENTF